MKRVKECTPEEVALKTFFLGPQAENAEWARVCLDTILDRWFDWRRSLFPNDGRAISQADHDNTAFQERRQRIEQVIAQLMHRFEEEVPKFSPRYIGHMFSEISLPALFGHVATLLHNPNNIAGESARVGTQLEDEAIAMLATMVGFPAKTSAGHFTSGGTVANFESIFRARTRMNTWLSLGLLLREQGKKTTLVESALMGWERFDELRKENGFELGSLFDYKPYETIRRMERAFTQTYDGPVILVPQSKHYSWPKGAWLMGLGKEACWPVELDRFGKMSIDDLDRKIEMAVDAGRPPLAVVSVAGTTELGVFDPVHEVSDTLERWRLKGVHIWNHIDAAYGGFFASLGDDLEAVLGPSAAAALRSLGRADSITLDPHKLGYVPYSSGTFLCKQERDYTLVTTQAPYLQFDIHSDRGPFTIEGSRSAAGAVATWLTGSTVGFDSHGYGLILRRSVHAKNKLEEGLRASGLPLKLAPSTESNICCFSVAEPGEPLSHSNRKTQAVIQAFAPTGKGPFYVSQTKLSFATAGGYAEAYASQWNPVRDEDHIACVRLCVMNPFFDSKETQVNYINEFIASLKQVLSAAT